MARDFDRASTEHLTNDGAPVTAYPFVMACWFRTESLAVNQTLMWLGNKDGVVDHEHILYFVQTANTVKAASYVEGTGIGEAECTTVISTNTWYHVCGLYVSATDRRCLVNGANKGTNATNITPTDFDRVRFGAYGRAAGAVNHLDGMLAEMAIWDLSVWPGASDSDKADNFERIIPALTKGYTPDNYPLGLNAYWPLIRGLNDKFGGYDLTADGTVVVPHLNIIQPCGVV